VKKSFFLFAVLFSVMACATANAGAKSPIYLLLAGILHPHSPLPPQPPPSPQPPIPFGHLSDTGQTWDYTATFGEDSDYTINPPSYTDNHNGTVTDNVTGLMWQQANAGGTASYNWYQAAGVYDATYNPTTQNVCGEQTTGGSSGWRLPTKKELTGIVDYGRYNPSIDPIFTGPASFYWSSTTYASYVSYAWSVDFDDGYVNYGYKSYYNYVRCVRGGQ
jgi:hypothetical protein